MVNRGAALAHAPKRNHKKLNKPLSTEARRNLKLLRAFWDSKAKTLGLTQAKVALRWGVGKSTVEQYLQGNIPLNPKWMLIFSIELQELPQVIWPQWAYWRVTSFVVPADAARLFLLWRRLDLPSQSKTIKFICSLIKPAAKKD